LDPLFLSCKLPFSRAKSRLIQNTLLILTDDQHFLCSLPTSLYLEIPHSFFACYGTISFYGKKIVVLVTSICATFYVPPTVFEVCPQPPKFGSSALFSPLFFCLPPFAFFLSDSSILPRNVSSSFFPACEEPKKRLLSFFPCTRNQESTSADDFSPLFLPHWRTILTKLLFFSFPVLCYYIVLVCCICVSLTSSE